jgi:hypothetical protein
MSVMILNGNGTKRPLLTAFCIVEGPHGGNLMMAVICTTGDGLLSGEGRPVMVPLVFIPGNYPQNSSFPKFLL